jgi:hypothetical protein
MNLSKNGIILALDHELVRPMIQGFHIQPKLDPIWNYLQKDWKPSQGIMNNGFISVIHLIVCNNNASTGVEE